ncbi:probable integral membrane proteinase [Erythrobacter sp. NAP1]|uniref:protease modulator HflC n=1 Tax=Erythrobacter sp. NAP1 TaxID=237727 RepID=UPI000068790A|nr:protease modulator HflC [Erythrobacter sp. NAP1]EAQ28933.1 probable integral membrane proteinase [Erythrobacter sp. NAP1]
MQNVWNQYKIAIIAVALVLIGAASTLFVTPETKQAVIIRTGEPREIVNMYTPEDPYGQTGAGFWYRIPFIDRVQMVERRVLDLDMDNQQVLTSDQQRLQVNAYARFRIIQPVTMVERAGDEARLLTQLSPILTSVLRQELGRRTFASLLTADRGTAMTNIRDILDEQAREYGVQIIDVRIKAADLPEGTPLEAAFTRMISDRQEQAETIRAQGRKNAQIIRAEADADAASTYADAYGKDPDFYDFYRAMESYRQTFINGEGNSSMVLDADNEYFNQFNGRP